MWSEAGFAAREGDFDFAAVSHLGHMRKRNEDSCHVAPTEGLAIVADGVGGQGDGAWASQRAVELFVQEMTRLKGCVAGEGDVLDILKSVHARMFAETNAQGGKRSGTTIAGIWAPPSAEGLAIAFNVGDSPIFRLSHGKLEKLSQDHSLYQLWLDGGCVGREPAKRMIVQALGISELLTPFVAAVRICVGDVILICTDGLSGTLPLERIEAILGGERSSRDACNALLSDALAGPAGDNVTAAVCHF